MRPTFDACRYAFAALALTVAEPLRDRFAAAVGLRKPTLLEAERLARAIGSGGAAT